MGIYQVETADGAVYQIETAEDSPESPGSSFISFDYGGESPTVGSSLMAASQGLAKGVGKGLLLPATLGVGLANTVNPYLDKLLGTSTPQIQSPNTLVDDAVEGLAGYNSATSQSGFDRAINTAGEFAGNTLATAGLGQNIARSKAAGSKLGELLASNPGAQVRAAIPAGLVSQVANEATEGDDSTVAGAVRFAAPLLAGGAYSLGEGALTGLGGPLVRTKAAQAQLDKALAVEDAQAKIAQFLPKDKWGDTARSLLAAQKADDAVPAIMRKSDEFLPQYQRTAERSLSPNLAAIEESAVRADPELAARVAIQNELRDAARNKIFKRVQGEVLDDVVAGQAVAEGLETMRGIAQAKVTAAADRAFKGGEGINIFPAKRSVTATYREFVKDGSRKIDGELTSLINNFKTLPNKVDFQTLQNYRSAFGEFSQLGKKVGATPVDKMSARIAGNLRSKLDEIVSESPSLTDPQRNAFKKMISDRKAQGELFDSKAVGKVLAKADYGQDLLDRSKVIDTLSSTPEATAQTMKALGQSSLSTPAKQAYRAGIMDKMFKSSTSEYQNAKGELVRRFNSASFGKNLDKTLKTAGEALTKSQKKALTVIKQDLMSQSAVKERAFAASRGQSITAQSSSYLKAFQSASQVLPFGNTVSIVGRLANVVRSAVKDPEQRKILMNRELAKFVMDPQNAIEILKTPKRGSPLAARFTAQIISSLKASGFTVLDSSKRVSEKELEKYAEENNSGLSVLDPIEPEDSSDDLISEDLLDAVKKTESSGNAKAVGPMTKYGTAKGAFQLLDSTGKEFHKKLGISEPYDPFNESQSRKIAKAVLTEYANMFDGDIEKAIMAYHAGPTNVKKGNLGPKSLAYLPKVLEALG